MIIAAFVLFIAILIGLSTIQGPRYRVEVCMYFNGRYNCKTVAARSEEAAVRSGIQNACADIVSGVSETMNCESSEPKSLKWLTRPGK